MRWNERIEGRSSKKGKEERNEKGNMETLIGITRKGGKKETRKSRRNEETKEIMNERKGERKKTRTKEENCLLLLLLGSFFDFRSSA